MQRDMMRTINCLLARGHAVEVFVMEWQGDKPDDFAVHEMPQKGLVNFKRYQRFIDAVFKQLEKQQFDYIVGYNRMAGLDAHFAADPCFMERLHQEKGALHQLLPRYQWFAACEKAVFGKDAKTEVLAVSKSELPHFQHWHGMDAARFHYIPPFLSPTRFALQSKEVMRQNLRSEFNLDADDFVFMLVGSGFKVKGLDRAIKALAALPAALLKNTQLIVVGQDNPKHFKKMADSLGIGKQVFISKGRNDTAQLMQGADAYVHPAYKENTGLVIVESMASNLPVLVTDSCGYASYVKEADAGLVAPLPFSQQAFNTQFLTMRQSTEKARWADNGLRMAKKLMQENDGGAEADILIELATKKKAHD